MKRMLGLLIIFGALLTGCPQVNPPANPQSPQPPLINYFRAVPVRRSAPTTISLQTHVISGSGQSISCVISEVIGSEEVILRETDPCTYVNVSSDAPLGGTRTFRLVVTDSLGLRSSAEKSVTLGAPPAVNDSFNIKLRYSGDIPAWARTDMEEAAREVEQMMISGLPDVAMQFSGLAFDGPVGPFAGVVDDVMVDVVTSSQQPRPASGFQGASRGDGTTILGIVQLHPGGMSGEEAFVQAVDAAFQNYLPNEVHEVVVGIFMHEILHTLGIGSGRNWWNRLQLDWMSGKFYFVGTHSFGEIPVEMQPIRGMLIDGVDSANNFPVSHPAQSVTVGQGSSRFLAIDIMVGVYVRYFSGNYLTRMSRAILNDLGYNAQSASGLDPAYLQIG